MRLWLGGEISHDVDDASFLVSKDIVDAVNAHLRLTKSYGTGLTSWDVIPIILPKSLRSNFSEVVKYVKKTRSYELRLCIDHSKFKKGSKAEQYRLYCNMLRRSLDYFDSWMIEKLDVKRLRKDFEAAVKHLDPGGAAAYGGETKGARQVEVQPIAKVVRRNIRVLKLYKKVNRVWHYHEAWIDGTEIGEHWGKVGVAGKSLRHRRDKRLSTENNLLKVLESAISKGYAEPDAESWQQLVIQFSIQGMGTRKDLAKRHKLETKLNDILGKHGLGQVVGGSTGMNSMEVTSSVISFPIAKRLIQTELLGSVFADYSRISKNT